MDSLLISVTECEFVLKLYEKAGIPEWGTADYAFYDLVKSFVKERNQEEHSGS